jgi:hypothetical protein
MGQLFRERIAWVADACCDLLTQTYGAAAAAGTVRWAEAFEPCEYGREWNSTLIRDLFPFLPQRS